MTKGAVEIEPYQKRGNDFPQVPSSEFSRSVFLFEPGRTSRGAEAVFRTMAYSRSRQWLLWLYEKFFPFKVLSDTAYGFIAVHRPFFSKISFYLWGSSLQPDAYFACRKIFIRGLALIYACAFASLFVQIKGLLGSNGILPAASFLQAVQRHFKSMPESFWNFPGVFWFNSSDFFLQGVCAAGVLVSLFLFSSFWPRACLLILWTLYLSIVSVGQDFLSFQWDILLLETGFCALFWAPRAKGAFGFADWNAQAPPFARGLLILILFKVMFSSGLVKLASGDPLWSTLGALDVHYETQPLPSPLSWWAHQAPFFFGRISVFLMFVIELVLPFFLFLPRNLRRLGAGGMLFLQGMILLTGNYGFFNYLSILLCFCALDDLFWKKSRLETISKDSSKFGSIITAGVFTLFFLMSSHQMARIAKINLPWKGTAVFLEEKLRPLRSISGYGLFAVMTPKRPEIIIEGSNDGEHWKNYEFKFKPGDINRLPAWVAPHQPRLDWQMWFAALGGADRNPWFIQFCARLLKGEKDVWALLEGNPFKHEPPLYLRAVLYRYQFTDRKERQQTGAWWKRQKLGLYLPPISLQNDARHQTGLSQ